MSAVRLDVLRKVMDDIATDKTLSSDAEIQVDCWEYKDVEDKGRIVANVKTSTKQYLIYQGGRVTAQDLSKKEL